MVNHCIEGLNWKCSGENLRFSLSLHIMFHWCLQDRGHHQHCHYACDQFQWEKEDKQYREKRETVSETLFSFSFFCIFSLCFFCICSQCYAKVFLFFLLLQVSNCPCKLTQDATLVVGFWFFIGSDCNVLIWFLLCLVFWWIIFCEELLKVTRVSHCKRNNIARSSQHFCSYTLHLLLI